MSQRRSTPLTGIQSTSVTSVESIPVSFCFFASNDVLQFDLPANLRASHDAYEALSNAKFIVHSIPIQSTIDYLRSIALHVPADAVFVSTSKGLDADTLLMMKDIIPSALDRSPPMAFVSGPSFAKELMQRQPTGLVVAAYGLCIVPFPSMSVFRLNFIA